MKMTPGEYDCYYVLHRHKPYDSDDRGCYRVGPFATLEGASGDFPRPGWAPSNRPDGRWFYGIGRDEELVAMWSHTEPFFGEEVVGVVRGKFEVRP